MEGASNGMNTMAVVAIIVFIGVVVAIVAFFLYRRQLRRAKNIERGLKMVPMLIHLPPSSHDTQSAGRDVREVMREKIAQAEVLYQLIAGTMEEGYKNKFYGQRHLAFEIIAVPGSIHFYVAVPVSLQEIVQKAILTAYPGARLEEAEDYNLFNPQSKDAGVAGGELHLKNSAVYPIGTYKTIEKDPLEAVINTLTSLEPGEGAGVQLLLRPATRNWVKEAAETVRKRRQGAQAGIKFGPMDLLRAAIKPQVPEETVREDKQLSNLELAQLEAVEEKTRHAGYDALVRVVVSTPMASRSDQLLRQVVSSFALYEAPGLNGFKFSPAKNVDEFVTAFIFRFFPPELNSNILNAVELATIFHLPDSQFTPSSQVERLASKEVDGPPSVPTTGLLLGYNEFRGVRKEIRLSPEDRRRHTYIIGQTGTGKSTLLENLALQDMQAGNGFAFIDPHGDTAEKLLGLVPKERAEDVVYFNPADMDYPLGLNLFEYTDDQQKDFLVQEAINMLYRLYDPGHTGIIGPRYEHWFRNAALTLMADPAGSTFIEIPKVFTDAAYLKSKFKYLKDPTVIDFWTKEMAQTSDYHKSEMLGWFVSKFGAFANNQMMRNIIGQTKSAFNLRDIMDKKKILIVNLSKGRVGELNSQLLGMILVTKIQAAAMARADTDMAQRPDFCLYVDEFQNFSTDSFADILSEARKYNLNLIVANQYIGQLTEQIRGAVFGNVGSMVSLRVSPEDAEALVKQFEPVFEASDLGKLPNGHAVLRLMIGGVPSQPFSMAILPPITTSRPELKEALHQLSQAKYGLRRDIVEKDIFGRLQATAQKLDQTPAKRDTMAVKVDSGAQAQRQPEPNQTNIEEKSMDPMQNPTTPVDATTPAAPVTDMGMGAAPAAPAETPAPAAPADAPAPASDMGMGAAPAAPAEGEVNVDDQGNVSQA